MSNTTFRLKRSAVAGKIPTVGQLALGEVAINTYDGKLYIKKDVNGTESIVTVNPSATTTALTEFYYEAADSGQTAFTGADENGLTLTVTPALIDLYLNGVLLDPNVDYAVNSDRTTVTLTAGADSGDKVQIVSITDDIQIQEYNYTATALQTTFTGSDNNTRTLSYAAGYIQVYNNGVLLDPNIDYTASNGTSVVLTTGATVGDYLQIFAFPQFNTSSSTFNEYFFEPTEGQTVLSGVDTEGNILQYNAGSIKVFNNGVLMNPDTDYTAINGTSVTFTVGLSGTDEVQINSYPTPDARPSYEDVKVDAGIYIGGTTDAYLMQEYKTGSFTPVIAGSTSAGTGTYTTQVGRYNRIGDTVNFTLQLVWSGHNGTGDIKVTGLPYTSEDSSGQHYVFSAATDGGLSYTDGDTLVARLQANSSEITLETEDGAGNNSGVTMDSSGRVNITGLYFI